MVEDMPTLFRILYCCGLRPGEVLHLEVGDVDLKKGVLLVRASKNDNDRSRKLLRMRPLLRG